MEQAAIRKGVQFVMGLALMIIMGGCVAVQRPVAGGVAMKEEATGSPTGVKIREVSGAGYKFEYFLLALNTSGTGEALNSDATHHLMIYITGPDGKPIEDATVSFEVTGRGAAQQLTLTRYARGSRRNSSSARVLTWTPKGVPMEGGYGADLRLTPKGPYSIRTTASFGDRMLSDEFTQMVQ